LKTATRLTFCGTLACSLMGVLPLGSVSPVSGQCAKGCTGAPFEWPSLRGVVHTRAPVTTSARHRPHPTARRRAHPGTGDHFSTSGVILQSVLIVGSAGATAYKSPQPHHIGAGDFVVCAIRDSNPEPTD